MESIRHNRIVAIDILKVFAVLAVLNSHMEICYDNYKYLSTGGAIGDALFFFCSGFMLFRSNVLRFDNFIKKKIARIYPTVFVIALVTCLFFNNNQSIEWILRTGGGWFVNCIMVYFALMWIIQKFFIKKLSIVSIVLAIIIISTYYPFFNADSSLSIYGNTYYKWIFFFAFMLQGAIIGMNIEKYKYTKKSLPLTLICIVAWYGILLANQKLGLFSEYIYISLIPLLGITYFGYKFCCAPYWSKIYNTNIGGQILYITGNLCLECYLIQFYIFTDALNFIFPLNIPLMMLIVLIVSYIINFMTNVLLQTLQKGNYEWNKTFLMRR